LILGTEAEKIKGQIVFPCCPKEKTMAYESSHGRASCKCPRCGKFALMDFDLMTAVPMSAVRGASHQFRNK